MMKIASVRRLLAPLSLSFALLLGACENPVGGGGEHPDGLVVLSLQGEELASYRHTTQTSTGRLVVGVGTSASFTVQLLARDGSRIQLDGLEYSIRQATVLTASRATASVTGTNQISVTGVTVGPETSILIPVRHGSHDEFVASIRLLVQ